MLKHHTKVVRGRAVSMERGKFEATCVMEAVSAAHFHQYTFVDGRETGELLPPLVINIFLPPRSANERGRHLTA